MNESLIKLNTTKGYQWVSRVDKLHKISGFKTIEVCEEKMMQYLSLKYHNEKKIYDLYKQSSSRKKFSRWIGDVQSFKKYIHEEINPNASEELIKKVHDNFLNVIFPSLKQNKLEFVISTKFKDILQAGDSNHYISCWKSINCNRRQLERILFSNNTALVFQRDKNGLFKWRFFFCLEQRKNKPHLVILEQHGNISEAQVEEIVEHLKKALNANTVEYSNYLYPIKTTYAHEKSR